MGSTRARATSARGRRHRSSVGDALSDNENEDRGGGFMGVQEQEQLWGGETTKAVANFPVSGECVPAPVVHWLGAIKGAAARVNGELGLLDGEIAERIAAAGDEMAAGKHDAQFPVDVFQTGS